MVPGTIMGWVALGLSVLARHVVATVVTVAVPCLLWTVTYVVMLVVGLLFHGDPGGPLAYPAGLLVLLVAGTLATLLLIVPSVLLAEGLARGLKLNTLFQIPISLGFLALTSAGICLLMDPPGFPLAGRHWGVRSSVLFAVHLLPLGLYWWVAQGGPILYGLVRWFWHRMRP